MMSEVLVAVTVLALTPVVKGLTPSGFNESIEASRGLTPPQGKMMKATGTFEVKLAPVGNDSTPEGPNLARMSLDKTFSGELAGIGKGEMITAAGTAVKESAAYSAVERITGTLNGKKGSFALQHTGVMDRGKPSLNITVVPDSGTGELVGLTGKMDIIIEGKVHKYVFEYSMTKE
jgi:hypothetical protein